ncbi:MAG: dUTP diphosphatase [Gammaproteobacteria bacterium]
MKKNTVSNPSTISPNAIKTMLSLQEQINQRIAPNWRDKQNPWYRAIWTECAELMEHHGWKWWKQQTKNQAQICLELVDIWHFGLSDLLQAEPDIHACTETILSTLSDLPAPSSTEHAPSSDLFLRQIERLAAHCLSTQRFDLVSFFETMAHAQLTFDSLFEQYVGKNVLNRFRQDHGYQEGTYQKQWGKYEDNEHLAELFQQLDFSADDLNEQLYRQLQTRYSMHTDAALNHASKVAP